LIDKNSYFAYSIALAFLITGAFATVQSDDLLACFMCGHAFTWDGKFREAAHKERFQEIIELLVNTSFFVVFGGIMPWADWARIGYVPLFLISLTVLLFKRLPLTMLLQPVTPVLRTKREAFFAGWFGPIGVGCVFFAM
jgi:NhaP-type Na+/H+ or K+/H+ antiporter